MKIYFVPLADVAHADGVDIVVDHAASLGFDTIASNVAPEAIMLGVSRCHTGREGETDLPRTQEGVAYLGEVCRRHELAFMLDLVIDRSDTPGGFLESHRNGSRRAWRAMRRPPDPRFIGQRPRLPTHPLEFRRSRGGDPRLVEDASPGASPIGGSPASVACRPAWLLPPFGEADRLGSQ